MDKQMIIKLFDQGASIASLVKMIDRKKYKTQNDARKFVGNILYESYMENISGTKLTNGDGDNAKKK